MIRGFRHKGLKELFEKGKTRKIRAQGQARCLRRLDALDAAESSQEMDIPGFRFHKLLGRPQRYSVWVTGNYRIAFEWQGKDAIRVDYEDYHWGEQLMSVAAEKVRRRRPPVHPGAVLREDVIPELGISVAEFAAGIHVSRQLLYRILAEKALITPEVALKLGKFLGNGPGIWLRMQQTYDLYQAEQALAEELSEIYL